MKTVGASKDPFLLPKHSSVEEKKREDTILYGFIETNVPPVSWIGVVVRHESHSFVLSTYMVRTSWYVLRRQMSGESCFTPFILKLPDILASSPTAVVGSFDLRQCSLGAL